MNIKIIKATRGTYWYADYVGCVFEVTRSCRYDGSYRVRHNNKSMGYLVSPEDCRRTKSKATLIPTVDTRRDIVALLKEALVMSSLPMPKSDNGAEYNRCGMKITEAIALLISKE